MRQKHCSEKITREKKKGTTIKNGRGKAGVSCCARFYMFKTCDSSLIGNSFSAGEKHEKTENLQKTASKTFYIKNLSIEIWKN